MAEMLSEGWDGPITNPWSRFWPSILVEIAVVKWPKTAQGLPFFGVNITCDPI